MLSFLCHTGSDLPGAFVVGEQAYQGFLLQAVSPGNEVAAQQRLTRYPQIALEVASFGNPGSLAGGEQPKFLATVVQEAQSVPVLVKYSPVVDNPLAQRISGLLVAEHLALSCLARAGAHAVESDLLIAQGRTFLEVRRFDRQGTTHRVGQVTLASLDAEYVGSDLTSWLDSASRLVALGILPESVLLPVGFLQLFGGLIGNSDMHFGNLAFFLDGLRVTSLAPAYDMLPMHYFPARYELNDLPFPLPTLSPAHAPYALAAIDAAATFWAQVASDPRISPAFQALALAHADRVAGLRAVAALLPE